MMDNAESVALAHVAGGEGDQWRTHALSEHLNEVAKLAAQFASVFDAQALAHLAGLWHDLGKYSAEFQAYIHNASGFERCNAHVEGRPGRVNHSSAGGLHAVAQLGAQGKILAQLILAHHAGLYDGGEITHCSLRRNSVNFAFRVEPIRPAPTPCGCACCFPVWSTPIFSIPKPLWMPARPRDATVGRSCRYSRR